MYTAAIAPSSASTGGLHQGTQGFIQAVSSHMYTRLSWYVLLVTIAMF